MHIVYAKEEAPRSYSKSIFLVGPTPRDRNTASWRPEMEFHLKEAGYDGVIFSPEPRDGNWHSGYDDQVNWEKQHLEMADLILAWVPRQLIHMPAFTTNVEFGKYVGSGKMLYGRPDYADKVRYLDWMYEDHGWGFPFNTMCDIAKAAVARLGRGSIRVDGERHIPLHIWNTQMFQDWYDQQVANGGNRLDEARILWSFFLPSGKLFSYALWAKMWVAAESRHKENEFVLSRSDIACVLPFWLDENNSNLLDAKIVLVQEYRLPVRNSMCSVLELPGGSSKYNHVNQCELAASELAEEIGLSLPTERFFEVQKRQLASTFSSHGANLFAVRLTDEELRNLENATQTFGVAEDSERTKPVVKTLREILLTEVLDWSTIGMVAGGLNVCLRQG